MSAWSSLRRTRAFEVTSTPVDHICVENISPFVYKGDRVWLCTPNVSIMHLLDLPTEVFEEVIHQAIVARGITRGLRLRIVNSQYISVRVKT